MTALSPAQHARLASALICGAVGDLDFDARGNVRYAYNRFEKEATSYSAILIEVNGTGMVVTPEGCDFLLENLQGGCYSKHDERAMIAVVKQARDEYHASRVQIDHAIAVIVDLADERAEALKEETNTHYLNVCKRTAEFLGVVKASMTAHQFNMVRDAYRAKIDLPA